MSLTIYQENMGSGPDLVLLHGWAMNSKIWGPWAKTLAEQYRVHLIDLPGFGKSPWPYDSPPDIKTYAADLCAHLPERALVVGWSLGGLIAQSIAANDANRVTGLLLLNTSACFHEREDWPCGTPISILEEFSEQLKLDHKQVLHDFVMLQCRSTNLSNKNIMTLYRQLIEHGAPDANALSWGIQMLRDVDHRAISAGINHPQTWVFGSQDKIVLPETAENITNLLPTATVNIIDCSAHLPFWSHPEECSRMIKGLI